MLAHRFHFVIFTLIALAMLLGCNRSSGSRERESGGADKESAAAEPALLNGPEAEEEMRLAALEGDMERVKKSLDAGINANALDQEGHTALMLAAYNGHTDIVLYLIDKGAVVDLRDLMGRTALLYASTGPFPETVKTLLDQGAEPNVVDSGEHFSPLMHAAAEGHLDVVKLLLEYGANQTLTDVDGDNAEFFARQAGHDQVVRYLQSIK
jgi:ankyrin repeat protein